MTEAYGFDNLEAIHVIDYKYFHKICGQKADCWVRVSVGGMLSRLN